MVFLAELVGRPLTPLAWFAPGIAATIFVFVLYGFYRFAMLPKFLFFGLFASYLGWIVPILLAAPAFTHRPIGGYSSPWSCLLACLAAVTFSAFVFRTGQNRKEEYVALGVGFVIAALILNAAPVIT